jgi:hypothetical protein
MELGSLVGRGSEPLNQGGLGTVDIEQHLGYGPAVR